jgi:protein gp37
LRKVKAAIRFLSVEPLLEDIGELDLTGIHWVIVGGGERQECATNGYRLGCALSATSARNRVLHSFSSSGGGWGVDGKKRSKHANGRILDGQTWDAYPEVVTPV